MTTLRITVQTRDILFRPAMFGNTIVVRQRAEVTEGVTLRNDGGIEHRGADIPAVFNFTLEFAKPIAQALIASGISARLVLKLKPHFRPERGDKMTIEGTVVELEEGEITRVITEKMIAESTPRK